MKVFKETDNAAWFVVRCIILAVVIAFTYYGFIEKQPCDLDLVFSSCNLTGTWGDWLGVPLFYASALIMSGVPKWFGVEWFNPTGGSYYGIVFAAGAAGILLFWFY